MVNGDEPSSLGCGCATWRHSCPSCSVQPGTCFLTLCLQLQLCLCLQRPVTSEQSNSPALCILKGTVAVLSCWREGGTFIRHKCSIDACPFLASDVAPVAVSGREVLHASILLLQEELLCCGQLPRTMLVWQLCVTLQTTLQYQKRWQHQGTKTLPWRPDATLRSRFVVLACSEGLSQTRLPLNTKFFLSWCF